MDSQWLQQCRKGDSLAIERLIQVYEKDVYRLALSILDDPSEAEDCTQEVFIAALRALGSFHEEASFKTWLFRITINASRSRLQRRKARQRLQLLLQGMFGPRDEEAPIEDRLIYNEADTAVWRAVCRLNDKHRIPVILRYYHELPVNEIAEILDVPPGTIHSRLSIARERLRKMLKEK